MKYTDLNLNWEFLKVAMYLNTNDVIQMRYQVAIGLDSLKMCLG